jgi:hypothetical protein
MATRSKATANNGVRKILLVFADCDGLSSEFIAKDQTYHTFKN